MSDDNSIELSNLTIEIRHAISDKLERSEDGLTEHQAKVIAEDYEARYGGRLLEWLDDSQYNLIAWAQGRNHDYFILVIDENM